jgi:hypothetical protein
MCNVDKVTFLGFWLLESLERRIDLLRAYLCMERSRMAQAAGQKVFFF